MYELSLTSLIEFHQIIPASTVPGFVHTRKTTTLSFNSKSDASMNIDVIKPLVSIRSLLFSDRYVLQRMNSRVIFIHLL